MEDDQYIRIISARRATKHERQQYRDFFSWKTSTISPNR